MAPPWGHCVAQKATPEELFGVSLELWARGFLHNWGWGLRRHGELGASPLSGSAAVHCECLPKSVKCRITLTDLWSGLLVRGGSVALAPEEGVGSSVGGSHEAASAGQAGGGAIG